MQQPLLLLKTQNHCKLQRFALCFTVCFTVRFTALHSAVRVSLCVSLRFTAPRVFHCSPKSAINAFVTSLRQMRTPIVFAAPQLLTSPQSQIKELVPPRLLSARQTPSFLSRRHTQRNRSTRSKAGTRPQTTRGSNRKSSRCGYCFQCPR